MLDGRNLGVDGSMDGPGGLVLKMRRMLRSFVVVHAASVADLLDLFHLERRRRAWERSTAVRVCGK